MGSTDKKREVKSLSGCTLKLDPLKSGMFMDTTNVKDGTPLTLAFFEGSKSEFNHEEGMKEKMIRRSIHFGILRVIKGKKDVTVEYGGPPSVNWKMKPLVKAPKPKDESKDKVLLELLKSNDVASVVTQILSIESYDVLERLYQLEKDGDNPTFRSRAVVIDAIEKKKKEVPSGITSVGKLKEEKPEIVTIT